MVLLLLFMALNRLVHALVAGIIKTDLTSFVDLSLRISVLLNELIAGGIGVVHIQHSCSVWHACWTRQPFAIAP